jgi:ABC-type antimicrobial peptide transport system permease subunit
MGATVKEIGGLHAVSGALVFVISFIANFGLSTLFCLGIFNIFTRVLPQLGIVGIRVSFDSFVPISTMLLYAIVSAICGCISSLIPFLLYKRKLKLEEKAIETMNSNMSKS